jgi:hypothetical protein
VHILVRVRGNSTFARGHKLRILVATETILAIYAAAGPTLNNLAWVIGSGSAPPTPSCALRSRCPSCALRSRRGMSASHSRTLRSVLGRFVALLRILAPFLAEATGCGIISLSRMPRARSAGPRRSRLASCTGLLLEWSWRSPRPHSARLGTSFMDPKHRLI